jgi:hypothetical protein
LAAAHKELKNELKYAQAELKKDMKTDNEAVAHKYFVRLCGAFVAIFTVSSAIGFDVIPPWKPKRVSGN